MRDLLTSGARLAVDHGHTGLVICVDEIQEAPRAQLVVLANAIQDALAADVALAVFAAGLPDTPEAVMAAASFTERFDFRVLGALEAASAERALLEPAVALGVRWDLDAARVALEAAGGSPYLIQRIGDEAWTRATPRRGGVVTLDHARQAVSDVRESLGAGMFRGRWAKATPAERELITATAMVVAPDGLAQTRHIGALLGKTTPQLSMVRKALLDKGLIEAAGVGRLRFTMPGFDVFVRDLLDAPWFGPALATGSAGLEQLTVADVPQG